MISVIITEKRCTKCGEIKSADSFTKTKATKDKLHSNCKLCRGVAKKLSRTLNLPKQLAKEAEYRERRREFLRTYHKDWCRANPEANKSHKQQWLERNKEYKKLHYKTKGREIYLEKTYGITEKDYQDMLLNQGGLCAICGTSPENRNRSLHVDHCHDSDQIRGLLCPDCNMAIGLLKDDKHILRNAIHYLEEFESGNEKS
jgi:hypothetical protein